MGIKEHKKITNMRDNVAKQQAYLVLMNKQELEKEEDVLKQLDTLHDKENKELNRLRNLHETHVDNVQMEANYKKKLNRVKEISVAREASEEAVKQFEINLENLGENVEGNE